MGGGGGGGWGVGGRGEGGGGIEREGESKNYVHYVYSYLRLLSTHAALVLSPCLCRNVHLGSNAIILLHFFHLYFRLAVPFQAVIAIPRIEL